MAVWVDSAIVVPILNENVTIGNNSCKNQLDGNKRHNVCYRCKHNVPDNACNQGITADITDGYCTYCGENPFPPNKK